MDIGSSKITRRAAVALVVTMLAAGPAAAQQLKTWRHGIVEAKSDAGFVFMAGNGGFAAKQGLKIEMPQFKGDALALRAMLAGELDSYEGNPGGPMIAASHGAEIKIVGCYWPILTYGIFARPNITTPKDLKGKTFAISAPGALPDLLARAVLEQNGLTASDVKFAVMGSDNDRYRALVGGVVDAAAASTELVPLANKDGMKLLVHAKEAVPNYLRFCIYTNTRTLAQRGDDVAHFLAAEIEGLRYALANRDKVVALAHQITGAKADDPRAGYIFDEVKKYSAIDPEMPVPADKLRWMQDLLVKTGNMDKPFDPARIIDTSARAKALGLIGN